MQATLKKKLGVDFTPLYVLGACNPHFAYQTLQAEPRIGTMLPCNVVLQALVNGENEVSAVDPLSSMQAIDYPSLRPIAEQVQKKMQQVIAALQSLSRSGGS